MKTKKKQGVVRRFLPYYKPYRKTLFLDLFFALLATLVDLAFPMLVKTITNDTIAHGYVVLDTVLKVAGVLLVLRAVEVWSRYYITKYGHIMGVRLETDLRRQLFDHLLDEPHAYFDNVKVGTLMSRITTDLFDVTEFSHHCPEEFFIAAVKIVGAFVILLFENVPLTLILFALLPVMILFAVRKNLKMRKVFAEGRVQAAEIHAQVEDSLSGVRVVKSFTAEETERKKFAEGNLGYSKIKKRNYELMGQFTAGIRAIDALMYLTIIVLAGVWKLDEGTFVAYLLYATTLLTTIKTIADYTEQFQKGITAFERFLEIMDTPNTLTEKPDAVTLRDVRGEVRLRDVSFRYGEGEEVLNHLNLQISPGETVALVGPSGGGKTTLASLIPRFYDVTGGVVSVDGLDVRDATLQSLRKNIGVVQQDVYLFWGTVRENIAYGNPSATQEEIERAARLAGADEFIRELEHGYDSYVGERGVKLSGGQKQRISIARVFLKNPPILILDEATSALDNASEVLVQQSLEELAKGRTTLVIAHRLSTIRSATKIVVLTKEGIEEEGTHAELMERGGLYRRLYELSLANASMEQ